MIVYKNNFFKIGVKNKIFFLEPKNQQVIILPIVDKNKFLLVKAKRPLHKKSMYEFPSGAADSRKETLIKAAQREFSEETGVVLKKFNTFIKMPNIYQMANRLKDPVYAFYVHIRSCQINYNNFDKSEIESLHCLSLKKIFHLISNGKFNSSVPISLLTCYLIKTKLFSA